MQTLDAAMKQYKTLSPRTACMFFSVDDDIGKILCMSCVPSVSNIYNNITSIALKYSVAGAQKHNKTKSLIKFKCRGHTGVIISLKRR